MLFEISDHDNVDEFHVTEGDDEYYALNDGDDNERYFIVYHPFINRMNKMFGNDMDDVDKSQIGFS